MCVSSLFCSLFFIFFLSLFFIFFFISFFVFFALRCFVGLVGVGGFVCSTLRGFLVVSRRGQQRVFPVRVGEGRR